MRCMRSARLTAVAATRSTTSPGPATGSAQLRRLEHLRPARLADHDRPHATGRPRAGAAPSSPGRVPEEHVAGVDRAPRAAARRRPGAARARRDSDDVAGAKRRDQEHRPRVAGQGRERGRPSRSTPSRRQRARSAGASGRRGPRPGRWRGPRRPCRGRGRGAGRAAPRAPRPGSPSRRRAGSSSAWPPAIAGEQGDGGVDQREPVDQVRPARRERHAEQAAEGVPHDRGAARGPRRRPSRRGRRRGGRRDHGGSQVEAPWPRRSGATTREPASCSSARRR